MNSEPLKVCLVAPIPPPYGGIANWTRLMLTYTPKNRVEFDVVNIAPQKRLIDGRTLFDRIIVSGFDMLQKRKKLKQKIAQNTPDAIHITTSGQLAIIRDILLLKVAKKRGIPSFYHIRFGRISEIAENNTLEWRLFSKASKLASTVIAIDKQTYDTIKENFSAVNAVLISNPIQFSELPEPSHTTNNTITSLGWIVKSKGIEELLEAWSNLYKDNQDWKLNLIGPYHVNYMESLKQNFSFKGVNVLGEKPHKDALHVLNKSKILVLPSYSEGFPNVILEAMALQKAIIATKVGAIPEIQTLVTLLKKVISDIGVTVVMLLDLMKV